MVDLDLRKGNAPMRYTKEELLELIAEAEGDDNMRLVEYYQRQLKYVEND